MLQNLWFGLHIVGLIAMIALLYAIMQKRDCKYKTYMMFTILCGICALVGRCLYITSEDLSGLMVANKMEYLGKCFANYFALLFILDYRKIYCPKWITYMLFSINAFAYFLIITAEKHHFYYSSIGTRTSPVGIILDLGKTPFYYFYMFFVIIEMLLYGWIGLTSWKESRATSSSTAGYLCLTLSCLTPIAFLLLQMSGIIKNIDLVPISIMVAAFFTYLAVEAYGLFEIVEDAKEIVLETLEEGILVVDHKMQILYHNTYAERFMKDPDFLNLLHTDRMLSFMDEENSTIVLQGHHYEIGVSELAESKSATGYLLSLIDITNLVHQAQVMKELKEKAEAANQAKSMFVSNLSHEIRTPMNAIVGMTEILMRDTFTEQQTEYLMNIKSSGNALLSIINDILDFSKMETGKFELVESDYEPMAMLNDLGMIFLTRIGEKDIELIFDIDRNIPATLHGDSLRIRQLIINLVNNAIKYTQKGHIIFRLYVDHFTSNSVVLSGSVRDSGMGIRQEDLGKLFTSFQRVDLQKNANTEGTGLGLSIAKQLVELMDGTIAVDSQYGKGSDFHFTIRQHLVDGKQEPSISVPDNLANKTVSGNLADSYALTGLKRTAEQLGLRYLPYDTEGNEKVDFLFLDVSLYEKEKSQLPPHDKLFLLQNPTQEFTKNVDVPILNKPLYCVNLYHALSEKKESAKQSRGALISFTAPDARVLVVDDNLMNRRVATGLLRPLSMTIDTAEGGQEAISMMEKTHYDLIFMDHMMPGMDGIEATKIIRDTDNDYFRQVPIIALTANAISGAKEEFLKSGMNDFVAKPIEINDIVAKIKKWLPEELIIEA